MDDKKTILVLGATNAERTQLAPHQPENKFIFLDVKYSSRSLLYEYDLYEEHKKAKEVIARENVDGLYFTTDDASLVAAQLVEECGFHGSRIAPTYNAYNKIYTRIKTKSSLQYSIFDIHSKEGDVPNYPFFFKDPCSRIGTLGYVVCNDAEFETAIKKAQEIMPLVRKPINRFVETYISESEFPHSRKEVVMLEELQEFEQITVDVFVKEGEAKLVAVSDTNKVPNTHMIDNFSTPSQFVTSHNELREKVSEVVRDIELTEGFLNMEFWCKEDGFELIEINMRPASVFFHLYQMAYGYDAPKQILRFATGESVDVCEHSRECVAGQFNVITREVGVAKELFNFSNVRDEKTYFQPDDVVPQYSDFGTVLAQFELSGDSYEEIKHKADLTRKTLIRCG